MAAPAWKEVRKFSGSGPKETESFDVASREWRITWRAKPTETAGYFGVTVHDSEDKLVSLAANTATGGGDTSYVRGRPGRYYLKINSANMAYGIVVEDQR